MTEIPTLYDWAGGLPALLRLTEVFYARVARDPLIGPIFADMSPEHPAHVAAFIGEVMGGPKSYSETHGGHPAMVTHHLNRHLSEAHRRAWVGLLLDSLDEAGLPADPEFRAAFVGYIEWGTRLAVINSQDGAAADPNAPMPAWNWGPPGGPYLG